MRERDNVRRVRERGREVEKGRESDREGTTFDK